MLIISQPIDARNHYHIFLRIIQLILLVFALEGQLYAAPIEKYCDTECAQKAIDYATLALHVYDVKESDRGSSVPGPGNWELFIPHIIPDESCHKLSNYIFGVSPLEQLATCALEGFKSGLYRRLKDGGNEYEYVMAFAGTGKWNDREMLPDMVVNVLQILGLSYLPFFYDQYDEALTYVNALTGNIPISAVVGHSLGGGLATYVSIKTGIPAYVFNPARLNPFVTKTKESEINSYIAYKPNSNFVRDPVSVFYEEVAPGTNYRVDIPTKWTPELDWRDPEHALIYAFSWHSMQHLKAALEDKSGVSEVTHVNYAFPVDELFAYQPEISTSTPGGNSILQIIENGTPNGQFTFNVKIDGTGEEYSFTGNFDSQGVFRDNYSPSLAKPLGTYIWWVTDNSTDRKSTRVPYKIVDGSSPDPYFGNPGYETTDDSPSTECLPDFVAKRTWITKSAKGKDKYVFEVGDHAVVHTKIKNIGCANSPQDISVWYFLSKGEKEDNHHDWVRIGDKDNIKAENLEVDEDHTEYTDFDVPDKPGKYNIVACADRISNYHNGYGEVLEEHKSNNCSTEAVFTVLPKKVPIVDSDGDGIEDGSDAFPNDPTEWLDTDSDGIGNNADTDDDNDQMQDSVELAYGFNPLDPADAAEDADNDGYTNLEEVEAGSDPKNSGSIPIKLPYSEDWESGVAGSWKQNTAWTELAVVSSEGNPGRYLQTKADPNSPYHIIGATDSLHVGNYALPPIREVSVDLKQIQGQVDSVIFRVRYKDSSHNGWTYRLSYNLTENWKRYKVFFDPDWSDGEAKRHGWIQEPSSASFKETLSNIYSIEIRISTPTPLITQVGIDNFLVDKGTENVADTAIPVPANSWIQFGLSCYAGKNSSVDKIFGDDIPGTYGTDWILYSYDTAQKKYIDPGYTGRIQAGVGYWFIHLSGNTIYLDMPKDCSQTPVIRSNQCPSINGCFEIPLATEPGKIGWTMAANAVLQSIAFDDLRVATDSGACSAINGCTLNQAASLNIVHNQMWQYAGSSGYAILQAGQSLKGFEGFWVPTLTEAHGLNPRLLLPIK